MILLFKVFPVDIRVGVLGLLQRMCDCTLQECKGENEHEANTSSNRREEQDGATDRMILRKSFYILDIMVDIPELRQGGEKSTKPPGFHRCNFQLSDQVGLKALQRLHWQLPAHTGRS